MPPQQPSNYDFILNSSPKPTPGPFFGGSKIGRILIVVVGITLLIIVAVVTSNLLNGASKEQNQRLVEIVKAQTEITRVASLASQPEKAKDLGTRIFAVNTRQSVESSSQQTRTLLTKRGVKLSSLSKQLAASKNPKTDVALDEATRNNRFDETFLTIMEKQLADYQTLLKVAHDGGTPAEKEVLNASFTNAGLLATEFKIQADPSQ